VKVVIPSTPRNARALLVAALRDRDPVVFMEPKRSYRAFKEEVPEEEEVLEIGKAQVLARGNDVALVAWILRRRRSAPPSAGSRVGGALFGALRGSLLALAVGLLAVWLDAWQQLGPSAQTESSASAVETPLLDLMLTITPKSRAELAADHADRIDEIDVNPVLLGESGGVAVDALLVVNDSK
jgi:hypothetical protein